MCNERCVDGKVALKGVFSLKEIDLFRKSFL